MTTTSVTVASLQALLSAKAGNLQTVMPAGFPFEVWRNHVLSACAANPRLLDALRDDAQSFYRAIHRAAALGLHPGDVFGHFFLIPFKNRRRNKYETVAVVGFRGYIELARRHPQVIDISAHLVYDGEEFCYDRATGVCEHPFSFDVPDDPDRIIGGYCRIVLATATGQNTAFHVLRRRTFEERRREAIAKGAGKADSPWVTHFREMCLKTVIRDAVHRGAVPMTAQIAEVEADERLATTEELLVDTSSMEREDAATTADVPSEEDEEMTPSIDPRVRLGALIADLGKRHDVSWSALQELIEAKGIAKPAPDRLAVLSVEQLQALLDAMLEELGTGGAAAGSGAEVVI